VVPVLKQARTWAALALVAVCGFALGACGGGSGGATRSLSVTLTRTVETQTVTTTTETQTAPAPPPPPPVQTTAAEPTSSSSTPWGWIVLGVALALALLLGLILWRRHRAGAAAWGRQTAEFNRRCLVALDDVLAQGSIVTGHVEALASEARGLEARAPDDESRAAAANVRARLDQLAAALATDRTLRLSSPPPSDEQVAYSSALIRQQAEQLQAALRPPGGAGADTWPSSG
jgi:hypothetical protein